MVSRLDKRVLVTGGSRGIGAAIALTLARNGADVAVSYERSADQAQEIVRTIENEGRRGVAVQADSDTALNPADGDDADYLRSLVPLGRYGTTDEVAAAVAFLAGPASSYMTAPSSPSTAA